MKNVRAIVFYVMTRFVARAGLLIAAFTLLTVVTFGIHYSWIPAGCLCHPGLVCYCGPVTFPTWFRSGSLGL